MDSVIGTKGGKVLLTIYFVNISLMLAFIRDANTSKSVINIYESLYQRLGRVNLKKYFQLYLRIMEVSSLIPNALNMERKEMDIIGHSYFTVIQVYHIRKQKLKLGMNLSAGLWKREKVLMN